MRHSTTSRTRLAALALVLGAAYGAAQAQEAERGGGHRGPIVIEEQGSFAFGGRVITDATDSTLHCDHGYAEFQSPPNARRLPLVMWHSTSTKTWTSTPGGPQGFQDIFLRRGFSVYIIDLPRQGRAGLACLSTTYTPDPGRDQRTFIGWRLGTWDLPGPPRFFPNSQAPHDSAFLNQVLRARYPDNENFEDTDSVEAGAVAALLKKIGPATLVTHSGSGRFGWLTAMRSPRVKGIVSFEPGVTVFPPGELPPPNASRTLEVPLADFEKLTRIPILVVYADFLEARQSSLDGLANARAFVKALNRHGGRAEVLHLPELGIHGNSHIMMLERNNVQVANLVSKFLRENGLDRRR
jgi:pimeloyl-ACP methyl ester carboxylesterase